jgi:hypothetical protein
MNRHRLIGGLTLAAIAACVPGCATEAPKPVYRVHGWCAYRPPRVEIHLTGPEGARVVDGEVAASFYPDRADRLNKFGSAVVSCRYAAAQPAECAVVQEDGDYGFGRSAERVAMKFPVPAGQDGMVRVRVRFVMLEPGQGQTTTNCEDLPPRPPFTDAADEAG